MSATSGEARRRPDATLQAAAGDEDLPTEGVRRGAASSFDECDDASRDDDDDEHAAIAAMSVGQLRSFLDARGVAHRDCIEKSELRARAVHAAASLDGGASAVFLGGTQGPRPNVRPTNFAARAAAWSCVAVPPAIRQRGGVGARNSIASCA